MARRGKIAEAEPYFRRTLDIQERTMGRDHPDVTRTYTNLANVYMLQKRFAEAEPLYARALEIRRRTLGPRHGSVAETLDGLAMLNIDLKRDRSFPPVVCSESFLDGQAALDVHHARPRRLVAGDRRRPRIRRLQRRPRLRARSRQRQESLGIRSRLARDVLPGRRQGQGRRRHG
jgi:tetratricopeptide (TPR) repeat protein